VELQRFKDTQLFELMSWFKDEPSCKMWGGPEFRFPFDEATFGEDCKLQTLSTWSFTSNKTLCAFGQFYLRDGRCHLARLAVSPTMRSQGVGKQFVSQLARLGCAELRVNESSLFVLANNQMAMRLYQVLGFESRVYTGTFKLPEACLYMVAESIN
jgi:ribosomal protein S18 acetylase RimI-like enzyme